MGRGKRTIKNISNANTWNPAETYNTYNEEGHITPSWHSLQIKWDKPLTQKQMRDAAAIVCYWAKMGNSQKGVYYWRFTNQQTLWVEAEFKTKAEQNLDLLTEYLQTGTPVRKQGENKGTRKFVGVSRPIGFTANVERPETGTKYFIPQTKINTSMKEMMFGKKSISTTTSKPDKIESNILPEADVSLKEK